MRSNIYVETGPQGLGVYALNAIPAGEEILTFSGRLVCSAQAFQPGVHDSHPLQVGPNLFIEPQAPARYVRHCCDPNSGIREEKRLLAIRDIRPHEEISYDYSTALDENDRSWMCSCGSPHCRKVIGSFRNLSILWQIHYLQMEIVQPFIVQKLCEEHLENERTPRMAAPAF